MIDYIEFIRHLEQKGYPFGTPPDTATQWLANSREPDTQRLLQRAKMLDATQEIQSSLQQWRQHIHRWQKWLSLAFFGAGWLSTYLLMQQAHLNFLLVLLGALGLHTLMLLLWCAGCLLGKHPSPPRLPAPKNQSSLHQYLLDYYWQRSQSPYGRWLIYAVQHQWALCVLAGVFGAAFMLLTVRQYTFNWQSTLWNADNFSAGLELLSRLPARLGFSTPDAAAVLHAQNGHDTASAAAWGQLFLGSILVYGMIPRAAAWLFCLWRQRQHRPALDLRLPYYQNIIQKWRQTVTDSADDYRPDRIAAAPSAPTSAFAADTQHWAVLLDSPNAPPQWFAQTLGQAWQDYGCIAEREELAKVQAALAQHSVQLLVGVRANSLPDRGNLRRLSTLSQHARAGIALLLLYPENQQSDDRQALQETADQWRAAAEQHGWLCLAHHQADS